MSPKQLQVIGLSLSMGYVPGMSLNAKIRKYREIGALVGHQ
jgi:hypothetical protein